MVTGSLQASYKGAVRKYGFEGEAGREGEGATRITESSYRRIMPSRARDSHAGMGGVLRVTILPYTPVMRVYEYRSVLSRSVGSI